MAERVTRPIVLTAAIEVIGPEAAEHLRGYRTRYRLYANDVQIADYRAYPGRADIDGAEAWAIDWLRDRLTIPEED